MTLGQAKTKFPNEWLAFRITQVGQDPAGELELHHPERHVFDKQLLERKIKNVYVTYSGEALPEGHTALF